MHYFSLVLWALAVIFATRMTNHAVYFKRELLLSRRVTGRVLIIGSLLASVGCLAASWAIFGDMRA